MTGINNCADQLSVCGAECCKQFIITTPKTHKCVRGETIFWLRNCSKDLAWYYKLHGAQYKHGVVSLKLVDFEQTPKRLIIKNSCAALTDDLQCKYHGTSKQPKICHKPNKEEHDNIRNVEITINCKYLHHN